MYYKNKTQYVVKLCFYVNLNKKDKKTVSEKLKRKPTKIRTNLLNIIYYTPKKYYVNYNFVTINNIMLTYYVNYTICCFCKVMLTPNYCKIRTFNLYINML